MEREVLAPGKDGGETLLRFDIEEHVLGDDSSLGRVFRYDGKGSYLGKDRTSMTGVLEKVGCTSTGRYRRGDIVGLIDGDTFRIGVVFSGPCDKDDVYLVDFGLVADSGDIDHRHPHESEIIPAGFEVTKRQRKALALCLASDEIVDRLVSQTNMARECLDKP